MPYLPVLTITPRPKHQRHTSKVQTSLLVACMRDEDRPSPRPASFPEPVNPHFSNFPAELLHQIFSYLVWTSPEQEDLIAASYVCQHWRAVALGNPLLWTQISLSYPRKALVFIERSQETCIEVKVPRSDPNVDATLGFLHRHRSRLRTIRADTDNFSATSAYLDFANAGGFSRGCNVRLRWALETALDSQESRQ